MENTSFQKPVNQIGLEDLFMSLAIWMEESPIAELPEDFSFCDESTNSLSMPQAGPKVIHENCEPAKKKIRSELNRNDNGLFDALYSKDERQEFEDKIDSGIEIEENLGEKEIFSVGKVGTVFVTQEQEILALDCSRDGIHGIVNVLVDFHDRVKNCIVYVSRKPCSSCVKLMIRSGISRVFYLPLTPENPSEEDLQRAERLSRVCAIGQSIYIPQIKDGVITQSRSRKSPYTEEKESNLKEIEFLKKYWNDEVAKQLRWPEFESLRDETSALMKTFLQWIFLVTYIDVPRSVHFNEWIPDKVHLSSAIADTSDNLNSERYQLVPDPNNAKWQEVALHWSRLAQIVSQQSDDPRRGVGAVAVRKNQVVAVGWNSYPPQAKYADFPRASDNDPECFQPKKYPYITHAEKAAILSRNTSNISHASTTLFVSKKPCDECVALLIKVGIKHVVFPEPKPKQGKTYLKYNMLKRMVEQRKIQGYQSSLVTKETQVKSCSL